MKMLVNGQWIDSSTGETIAVFNPSTHKYIDSVPSAQAADINNAVSLALEGYRLNRRLPALKRFEYLEMAGRLLLENIEELRETMILENGKSWSWADFEVKKSAEILLTLAHRVKDPQGATYPMDAMDGCATQMSMQYRQPRGVVGGIIPFNFPLEMLAYKIGGALAAGNSIVVKLSEDCPLTCLKAGQILLDAGVPPQVFHLLPGYGHTAGEALVDHPLVPMINFTGSSAVGRRIMERAAKHLKHLSLELGGNDPVIVFDDANLELVAQNIVRGRMTVGNGQACVADKRFIVHEKVYESLLQMSVKAIEGLVVGNPIDPKVDVGPVITENAAINIERQIRESEKMGATVLAGGERINKTFILPTIVRDVTDQMPLFIEECFGPVAPFTVFCDEQQAINLANDSIYGLQGAVYTRDISRAMRVADEIDVGGVVVNGSSCFRPGNVPYMPRKQSGLGTDNMFHAYEEDTQGKVIVLNNVLNKS